MEGKVQNGEGSMRGATQGLCHPYVYGDGQDAVHIMLRCNTTTNHRVKIKWGMYNLSRWNNFLIRL